MNRLMPAFALALLGLSPPPTGAVVLRAAGDVMMHNTQTSAGYDPKTGGYSFRAWFNPIAAIVRDADLALVNLETPLAGRAAGYTGYPRFNAPAEIAMALQWAGFDVITTANNHAMDRGRSGVLATIAALDRIGVLHTGTFASAEARATPLVADANGIKVGVIACTYDTNGIAVPDSWLVNRIDGRAIAADAAAARSAGAELVVACIHWGDEYARRPSATQRAQAKAAVEGGVDVIFGSHPHVVQPIAWVDGDNGRRGVCFYSLGNFVADQRGAHRDEGILGEVELTRDEAGAVSIGRVGYIPTLIDRRAANGRSRFRVWPVRATLDAEPKDRDLRARLRTAWRNTTARLEAPEDGVTAVR